MQINIFLLIVCTLILSCQDNTHNPSQHIHLHDLRIDTSYGYPFPANYNWEEMVKNGKLNELPRKNPSSHKPLINFLSNNTSELYRISAFPYTFLIIFTDTSSEISIKMSNHTDDDMQYSKFIKQESRNEIQTFQKKVTFGKKRTVNLRNLIQLSNFWSTEMHDEIIIMDFSLTYEMEGIKDSTYSLIWQAEPKEHNKHLYKTVRALVSIAEKEGLVAQTDGRIHW